LSNENETPKATQKELDNLHKKFDDHYEDRMDRIEKKLDELTSAVVSIARAEEKITALMDDSHEIKQALNQHVNRIHQLELDVEQNKGGLENLSKFFWIVVTAVVASGVAFIFSQAM